MEKIALPQKISILPGQQPYEELIVVEPFFPGYGTTIGNALRRVLLSSLPGAAVVGVKIAGADHEFKGLIGVQEDVLNIVLNLKKLRLKVFSEDICKLNLEVSGKKTVTAADITPNSQVEIINQDLVLANLTDAKASLQMEIFVHNGRGYEMVENRLKIKKEIGYIEIDSIFTPVIACGLSVENVRVGKMVNWDKLILRITTDGTITPHQAFVDASQILIDQLSSAINLSPDELVSDESLDDQVTEEELVVDDLPEEDESKSDELVMKESSKEVKKITTKPSNKKEVKPVVKAVKETKITTKKETKVVKETKTTAKKDSKLATKKTTSQSK